ncbi:hypothetical protein ACFQY0_19410 [Haloferula chungangensis]|uniref:Uncharacterized protein n=1 Tax=Haloferula chungangensis TaxID=1048331 RepID=A0ABW2LC42_9BACT
MKTTGRTTMLAWACGIIFAAGFAFLPSEGFQPLRLVPAIALAGGLVYHLLTHPEKATPRVSRGILGPILVFLILYSAATRDGNFGYIVLWSVFFFGSYDAFSQRVFQSKNRSADHPKATEN